VMISELPALGGAPNEIEVATTVGRTPAIAQAAWNGAGYGTVWVDAASIQSELTVVASGTSSVVALGDSGAGARIPTVAWDGTHFIVAYGQFLTIGEAASEIWAGLFDATGTPVPGCGRRLLESTWTNYPAIDWDGNDLVILYTHQPSATELDLRALRITPETLE